ncbi:MAG: AmmeMemoRadiSam system radical SAM enzyme [bacterium]
MGITRREMLRTICGGACLPLFAGGGAAVASAQNEGTEEEFKGIFEIREVPYYEKLDGKTIQCKICPKECKVGDQERGYCGNKENRGGKYFTLAYGNPCAYHVDPIEKKPLFHFLPGTAAFSISTAGCNFNCKFCQNWDISQSRPEQTPNVKMMPGDVVHYAKQSGSATIAYTYGEPVVFYKYMYDTAALGHKQGVRSVMITNGYINKKPMRELLKVLDAVKVDFKAYTKKFYTDTCDGELKPVLDTLVLLKEEGMWTELVYLVVPTLNDSKKELQSMTKWIMKNLGPDVPIHFSRFHPTYMIKNLPSTPIQTLEMARDTAMEGGLNFAYIGNVPNHEGENTCCPGCKSIIVERMGYTITKMEINKSGKCRKCGHRIPGVWK